MGNPEAILGAVLDQAALTLLRATLLLAAALGASVALRKSSATLRHALWTVTLAALVALPVLPWLLPSIPLPLPGPVETLVPAHAWMAVPGGDALEEWTPESGGPQGKVYAPAALPVTVRPADREAEAAEPLQGPASTAGATPPLAGGPRWGRSLIPLLLWGLGALAFAIPLGMGVRRARRLIRRAEPLHTPEWRAALRRSRQTSGFHGALELLLSPEAGTALAGGLRRRVIVVPEASRGWPRERREVVLVHELVHLRRCDPLRQILGRVALVLYWFHPLAWCAVRMAGLAREQACDETVVALGHRPAAYARHLLVLSERALLPLPPLAHLDRPHLEKRIMAILSPPPIRRPWAVGTTVALALMAVMTLAAISPAGHAAEPLITPSPAPWAAVSVPAPVSLQGSGAPPSHEPTGSRCDLEGDPQQEAGSTWSWEAGRGWSILRDLNGLVLCAESRGDVEFLESGGRIGSMAPGSQVVLAVRWQGSIQRMEIDGGPDGPRHRWWIDGDEAPFDQRAEAWRDAALDVVGGHLAIVRVRGQEARLRGEIARARGQEARLRGEIARGRGEGARLRGERARILGEGSRLRGEEARLRGEEARIRGEMARIRGVAAGARGEAVRAERRIRALEAAAAEVGDDAARAAIRARIGELDEEVRELRDGPPDPGMERALAEPERRLAAHREMMSARRSEIDAELQALESGERMRELEETIRRHDQELDHHISEIESRISGLEVEARVQEIESGIGALRVDEQLRLAEDRIEAAGARLRALLREPDGEGPR